MGKIGARAWICTKNPKAVQDTNTGILRIIKMVQCLQRHEWDSKDLLPGERLPRSQNACFSTLVNNSDNGVVSFLFSCLKPNCWRNWIMSVCSNLLNSNKVRCLPEKGLQQSWHEKRGAERMLSFRLAKNFNMWLRGGWNKRRKPESVGK